MAYVGSRMMAAVFRSVGIEAAVTAPSDAETLELGGLHSSGEECYPQKITLGDFMRLVRSEGFDPSRAAFFMPTAKGPCRFGQYGPYLRHVLDELGYTDVPIISPTSDNNYGGLADHAPDMVRCIWRSMVAGECIDRMLLKTRPYESAAGTTDAVYEQSLDDLEQVVAQPGLTLSDRLAAMLASLTRTRSAFRSVQARYTKDRPLIGLIGEIYCRLNTFANGDAIRQIEAHGGEVWLSFISEWLWYTGWSQQDKLRRTGKRFSLAMAGAKVRSAFQRRDEEKIVSVFADDFVGYEEPHNVYKQILKPGWPYLPADGALGEMAMSVGRVPYLHGKGADGIIDISPFSCMNGIISEAVYHAVARDYDDIPIRNFYFDASSSNMDQDLDIFMELTRNYQKRKTAKRVYPSCFET